MAQVTAEMIKQLREATGVGMGKCKEALEQVGGDMQRAIDHLRRSGMATAVKKEGRETNEGVIKVAESADCFALLEVNAETDFVVKNEKFQAFATACAEEACKAKPTALAEFLGQTYSKDRQFTIDQYRATMVQSLGENIQIKRVEVFPKKPNTSLGIYSHMGGKLVTVVEIGGSSSELELARDIAMHVAAEAPEYLSRKEVPQRVLDHEMEIATAQIKGKPPEIAAKIAQGKVNAYVEGVCLEEQFFVKNPKERVGALVASRGGQLRITQFLRWKVGQ